MLILTRRPNETLTIGTEITVTVLGVKGNQVRIGVNAPKNVSVHREEIFERIKTLNLESRVLFPGFVAEDDKRFVLCAAELFIYPSFYEGFGLPVLEALACGVPTITSNTSSLPEVAGGAALMVEPTSTEEISHALEQLLTDVALRQQLREASIRQASLFTWQKTAAGTVRMYRGVFDGRGLANPA